MIQITSLPLIAYLPSSHCLLSFISQVTTVQLVQTTVQNIAARLEPLVTVQDWCWSQSVHPAPEDTIVTRRLKPPIHCSVALGKFV